ncbi:MAG: flavin reductase family protein [Bacteroidetes bacterium]|nr:flavin reductase family protein [Bacteroidota bacterium]
MLSFEPNQIPTREFHAYMLASIAPRPICFASTMSKEGKPNLSPFSFFNAFGSNPPILIFSPARRVRDNTIKHTLINVYDTMEVCINMVSYDMVQQMSLASCEYEAGVDEFIKAGFTKEKSVKIKPFRVMESPVQLECIVKQVIETGKEGGAGNLIICEIVMMHIKESILTADRKIDQNKIDLVGRLGVDSYVRASGNAVFEVEKPNRNKGIGIDALPENIRHSHILSGNNLGQLGNVEKLPSHEEIEEVHNNSEIRNLIFRLEADPENLEIQLHTKAKQLLDSGNVAEAWKILLVRNT